MVKLVGILYSAILTVSPALACGVIEKADPRVGSTVKSTDHVTLTFSQVIIPDLSNIKITDSTDNEIKVNKPISSNDNKKLSFAIANHNLIPGKYKIYWEMVWLDCLDKTHGKYKFTIIN